MAKGVDSCQSKFNAKMLIICKVIFAIVTVTLSYFIPVSTEAVRKNVHRLGAINNNFAVKLLHELRSQNETMNIFISPLSISMTFGMLYYGAAGNTAEELNDVLGYLKAGMSKESVHLAFKPFLKDELKKSEGITLNAANAILVDNELGLSSDFKNKVQETYFANVSSVEFQTDTSKIQNDINTWVSKQTNEKISKLLNSLDRKTAFIILNAVYFKGFWKYPFDPKNTNRRKFVNNNEESEAKLIDMMRMTERFGISSISDFQVLELPYVMDDIVMLIMLPKHDLGSLEPKINHRSIIKIFKEMRYTRVKIFIPKFKIEFERSLVPDLRKLGIRNIFENADFSGMIENDFVRVSEFLHKAVIEVNEEGTEAAAATLTMTTKSLIPVFIVDRPFIFAIIDKRINFILFLGHVSNL